MADKFRNAAKGVLVMQNTAKKWKANTVDDRSASANQKTFIGSFKHAVDKVKLKNRFVSPMNTEEINEQDHEGPMRNVFNLTPHKRRVTILQDEEEEQDRNILSDLPPMTDREVIEFTSTELAGRFLNNRYFRYTILATIITNSLLIAVETDKDLEREYNYVFKILDQCMMTVFVCEILLKWYHGFTIFWKQGWNILDFLIVVLLIFGPLIMGNTSGGRGVIRILRCLRAFRSLRSISSLPGLQVVVQTILQSIPDMTNIVVLLVIIMLVFAVIGITLFRDVVPDHFGGLSTAMFSLFICVTQDGWMEIFTAFQEKGETYYISGGVFLIFFISIGAFIFANLVVAVVVTNLECAVKDVRQEEEEQAKEMEMRGKLELEGSEELVDVIKGEDLPGRCFQAQTPIIIPNLSGLNIRNIEHYFLIASAMEENLSEYMKMKLQFAEFFDQVCELNKSAIAEGVIKAETTEQARQKKRASAMSYDKASVHTGDIMSNMMSLETSQFVSSKTKNTMSDVVHEVAWSNLSKINDGGNIQINRGQSSIKY